MKSLVTDGRVMAGPFERAGTAWLLSEAARLEATQHGHFTISVSDSEKQYLAVMAELFSRGRLPLLGETRAGGDETCTEQHRSPS